MKISVLKLGLLISALIFTSPLLARRGEGPKHHKMMEKVFSQLDLSEEQEAAIKKLHQGSKEKHRISRKQMRETREKFHSAMQDSSKTDSELKELHEALISQKSQMMRLRFGKMLATRSILNPEQRQKFHEIMKERKGKRRGHHKRGRGGGFGGDGSSYDDL